MKELIKFSLNRSTTSYTSMVKRTFKTLLSEINSISLFSILFWIYSISLLLFYFFAVFSIPLKLAKDIFDFYILWRLRGNNRNIEYVNSHLNLSEWQVRSITPIRKQLVAKTVTHLNKKGINIENPLLNY